MLRLVVSILMVLVLVSGHAGAVDVRHDVSLVLAVDGSGSVDQNEYTFQMESIARALQDPAVRKAIRSGPEGRIEAMFMVWADGEFTPDASPWFTLSSDEQIDRLAHAIRSHSRRVFGDTGIGPAIRHATERLVHRNSGRLVINLSGDGRESIVPRRKRIVSTGAAVEVARENGIIINGLAIEADDATLGDWYRQHVQTGPDSFVMTVSRIADFQEAMRRKLIREIEANPLVALAHP